MTDAEYVSQLCERLEKAIFAICKAVGPYGTGAVNKAEQRALNCEADRCCQDAGTLATSRMVEIARRYDLPEPESWGRRLLDYSSNQRHPFSARLEHISLYHSQLVVLRMYLEREIKNVSLKGRTEKNGAVAPRNSNRRNQFCYEQLVKGKSLKNIRSAVNKRATFDPITSLQGISQAAKRYAKLNALPWPLNKR